MLSVHAWGAVVGVFGLVTACSSAEEPSQPVGADATGSEAQAIAAAPPLGTVPFVSPVLSIANNDKCTSTTTGGASDVMIRSVRLNAACTVTTGCVQNFNWPIAAAAPGVCTAGGVAWDTDHAKAYLTGYRIQRRSHTPTQLESVTVQVDSEKPLLSGGTWQLPLRISVAELPYGPPNPVVEERPALDVIVNMEIVMASPGNGLSVKALSGAASAPGPVVLFAVPLVTPDPLQFVALNGFTVSTTIGTLPSGQAQGSNVASFGIGTKVMPLPGGGSNNDVTCVLAGDTPTPAAQLTQCTARYVALVGSHSSVQRAAAQPAAIFGSARPLDETVSSWAVPVAANGMGVPSCGMKTFQLRSVPATVPVSGGVWNITSFKSSALGFRLTDCDRTMFMSGQHANVTANGRTAYSPSTGIADQYPVIQFGNQTFQAPP